MKNVDILIKLATLKKEDCIHEEFDFNCVNTDNHRTVRNVKNCGTSGCLIGELPGITTDWYFDDICGDLHFVHSPHSIPNTWYVFKESLCSYFDLKEDEINYLFIPGKEPRLPITATLEQVQERLKNFLIANGVTL